MSHFYTPGEAAKATGKSKSTITRAIHKRKLSAEKDADGIYQIDPAELHRVYPPKGAEQGGSDQRNAPERNDPTGAPAPTHLVREIEIRDQQLEAERTERERERRQAQEVIDDLRIRLDGEAEERRKLTRLLTDQSAGPEPKKKFLGLFG